MPTEKFVIILCGINCFRTQELYLLDWLISRYFKRHLIANTSRNVHLEFVFSKSWLIQAAEGYFTCLLSGFENLHSSPPHFDNNDGVESVGMRLQGMCTFERNTECLMYKCTSSRHDILLI